MSRKDDLKLVFDFIAEYLKGDDDVKDVNLTTDSENTQEPTKSLLYEKPFSAIVYQQKNTFKNDDDESTTPTIETLKVNVDYIKGLMDRMERIDINQAHTNKLLALQQKNYEKQIKNIKNEYNEALKEQKDYDERINDVLDFNALTIDDDGNLACTETNDQS